MSVDELLEQLHIDKEPIENENGSYTIELDNSNEYSKYYTKLEKSDIVEQDDEASQVGLDTSSLQYINDNYIITLLADWNEDEYKIIIRNIEKYALR